MTRSTQLFSLVILFLMAFGIFYLVPFTFFKVMPASFPFLKNFFIWNTLLIFAGCVAFVQYTFRLMNDMYSARKASEVTNANTETGDKIN